MSNADQQPANSLITLSEDLAEGREKLAIITMEARQALFNAWALFERGETDLDTLGQALSIVDDQMAALAAANAMQEAALAGMGEAMTTLVEQRNTFVAKVEELQGQIGLMQDDFEEAVDEAVIDRTEYLAQAEDAARTEDLATEIAFESGFEVVAAQERAATEARLKRAQKMADGLVNGLNYDYDNEPDEDDTEDNFDSDDEDSDDE